MHTHDRRVAQLNIFEALSIFVKLKRLPFEEQQNHKEGPASSFCDITNDFKTRIIYEFKNCEDYMKEFLITFTGQHKNWNNKTEADWAPLRQKHEAWIQTLVGKKYKAGAKLASVASKVITLEGGKPKITDGPFAETKELLTGVYLIEAENMNHAVELAKGCPWLLHDTMEISEVEL